MKHVIKYPAVAERFDPSSPLKTIVWDDEAGAVEGDHQRVPDLAQDLEEPVLDFSGPWGGLILDDAAHDPRQFITLLCELHGDLELDPRTILPDSLKGIKRIPYQADPPEPGVLY